MNTTKLNFKWIAYFTDGSTINQFEISGKENPFQKVKDRFSDLSLFSLQHITKPLKITVDLRRGLLFYNDLQIVHDDLVKNKNDIRLIVFRRHNVTVGTSDLKEKEHSVVYFIGYQYLDIRGRNNKVLIQLDQEGNMVIGD